MSVTKILYVKIAYHETPTHKKVNNVTHNYFMAGYGIVHGKFKILLISFIVLSNKMITWTEEMFLADPDTFRDKNASLAENLKSALLGDGDHTLGNFAGTNHT